MVDRDNNATRPGTRPFVGGRPVEHNAEPQTFSYAPARPFSFTNGERKLMPLTSTVSTSVARPQRSPTPLWSVAVYEPGLERSTPRESQPPLGRDDFVEASLALADDVREAQRHASSLTAAATLRDSSPSWRFHSDGCRRRFLRSGCIARRSSLATRTCR
jgi:hypothetical protein